MAVPRPKVRELTYERDGHRCALCGATDGLSFQHRMAVGAGGSKHEPSVVEGLTLCTSCNVRVERDLQSVGLAFGMKIPRWPTLKRQEIVPVLYWVEKQWYMLRVDGSRHPIEALQAKQVMRHVYGGDLYDGWADRAREASRLLARA